MIFWSSRGSALVWWSRFLLEIFSRALFHSIVRILSFQWIFHLDISITHLTSYTPFIYTCFQYDRIINIFKKQKLHLSKKWKYRKEFSGILKYWKFCDFLSQTGLEILWPVWGMWRKFIVILYFPNINHLAVCILKKNI